MFVLQFFRLSLDAHLRLDFYFYLYFSKSLSKFNNFLIKKTELYTTMIKNVVLFGIMC